MVGAAGPPAASSSSGSQSWTSTAISFASTQQGRYLITALAASSATAASIFSYQAAVRLHRRRALGRTVDKATHRDQAVEKRFHGLGSEDGEDGIDGGTPKYLGRLNHLAPPPGVGTPTRNHVTRGPSPLARANSTTSVQSHKTKSSSLHPTAYDESLVREQLSRNYSFLGDEAMKTLRESFVVVVGLGGVGSHVALSLIRSGVGHVRLIDFDQVSLSSLNRHAVATLQDVGRPKAIVCQEHFASIAPWVRIQAWVEIFNESEAGRLFSPFRVGTSSGESTEIPPTYVIDCIDNLNTKVGLLAYCHEHKIKVFASMGAGAKCDPTRICIGDLTMSEEDPLAKSVRRRLRERGIPKLPEKEEGRQDAVSKKKGKLRVAAERAQQAKEAEAREAQDKTPRKPASKQNRSDTTGHAPTPPAFAIKEMPSGLPQRPSGRSRASSSSSFGSGTGAYFTPEGTPSEESRDFGLPGSSTPPQLSLDSSEPPSTEDVIRPSKAILGSPKQERPSLHNRMSSGLESLPASPMPSQIKEAGSEYPLEQPPSFAASTSYEESQKDPTRSGQFKKRVNTPHSVAELEEAARAGSPAATTPPLEKAGSKSKMDLKELRKLREQERKEESIDATWAANNPTYILPTIFSTEKPSVELLPLPDSYAPGTGEDIDMLRLLEDGNDWRVRILPVLGPLPAIFGLSIAAWVICDMSGRSDMLQPLDMKTTRRGADRVLKDLEASERRYPCLQDISSSTGSLASSTATLTQGAKKGEGYHKSGRVIPFLLSDVLYLLQEVFHARSIVAPTYSSVSTGTGVLLRWDSTVPLSFGNVALFAKEEGKRHTEEVLKKGRSPVEVWGEETRAMWGKRQEEEKWYSRFR